MKTRTLYMHTMQGMPASKNPISPAIWPTDMDDNANEAVLVRDLKTIRAEQKAAEKYLPGFKGLYGYIRVKVPV